jgi:hypothetical protein
MSINPIDRPRFLTRREFLTLLPLALLVVPGGRARAGESRKADYTVDVGILYDVLTFHLAGTIVETVDRAAGWYEVKVVGEGAGIGHRIETNGIRRGGRWAPAHTTAHFHVKGRESRSDVRYDYGRRLVEYHFRGETFLLRRPRVADDLVPLPEAMHVDDLFSATLNYADALWQPQADGSYRTTMVRRRRKENEGPDDVEEHYGAELVPFGFRMVTDPESRKVTALVDLTGFSSWASKSRPARIVFGAGRRPEAVTSSLILGTSLSIRIQA